MKSGWALTIAVCLFVLQANASDVRSFGFSKARRYSQINAGAPVVSTGNAYEFHAFVELNRPNSVTSATIKYPSGTVRALTNEATAWRIREQYSSALTMNSLNPNGQYTFVIKAALDGARTNAFTLNGDFYPVPIHVSNFAAAQEMDSTKDFVLQWDPTGQRETDLLQLQLFDSAGTKLFETGDTPGATNSIKGNATSFPLPHNLLAEGRAYRARLILWNVVQRDTTSYPGAYAFIGYITSMDIQLQTAFQITDVQWYGVMRKQRFSQTFAGAPALLPQKAYEFDAFTEAAQQPALTAVSLKLENNTVKNLAATGSSWLWRENFNDLAGINQTYPNRTFRLAMNTAHDGVREIPLDMSTSTVYPGAPQISNWNDANNIDPAKPFTLTWSGFAGGTVNDFVKVILDSNGQVLFHTGNFPKDAGALNGTANSVILPANLLKPGSAYNVTILSFRPYYSDPFTYPRVTGVAGYASETTAVIRTRGGAINTPALMQSRLNSGLFEFTINSAMNGRQYSIQSSPDLKAWTTIWITNAPAESFLFRTPVQQGRYAMTFRVFSN
jgi:hypothetical protein